MLGDGFPHHFFNGKIPKCFKSSMVKNNEIKTTNESHLEWLEFWEMSHKFSVTQSCELFYMRKVNWM